MRGFPQNAVCVVGLSKAPSQNPITFVHQSLIGSFVVDNTTGRIYAVQFNTICGITSNFLEEQLVGLSLLSDMASENLLFLFCSLVCLSLSPLCESPDENRQGF